MLSAHTLFLLELDLLGLLLVRDDDPDTGDALDLRHVEHALGMGLDLGLQRGQAGWGGLLGHCESFIMILLSAYNEVNYGWYK